MTSEVPKNRILSRANTGKEARNILTLARMAGAVTRCPCCEKELIFAFDAETAEEDDPDSTFSKQAGFLISPSSKPAVKRPS